MGEFLPKIILNDAFVTGMLSPVANRWPAMVVEGYDLSVQRLRNKEIKTCFELMRGHYARSDTFPEERLLGISLEILVKVLALEECISDIRHLIMADWKAHVELDKSKRYRDHITHPVRVTAVGWWLLFRDKGRLMVETARSCEHGTRKYRRVRGINIRGWWDTHLLKGELEEDIRKQIRRCTPGYDPACLDPDLLPWMALVGYAWLACGLLHDAAYPLEHQLHTGSRLNKRFGKSFGKLGPAVGEACPDAEIRDILGPLVDSWFMEQVHDLDTRLLKHFQDGKNRRPGEFKHSHAILGALHQLAGLTRPLHSIHGLVLQIAARAIATHHDKADDKIVDNPLAKLLYVSDSLQAWGRPFLHRKNRLRDGSRKFIPLIDCHEIRLSPQKDKYLARFLMNKSQSKMALLKNRYEWKFDKFNVPNQRIEKLLSDDEAYPDIVLADIQCVLPKKFRDFMGIV